MHIRFVLLCIVLVCNKLALNWVHSNPLGSFPHDFRSSKKIFDCGDRFEFIQIFLFPYTCDLNNVSNLTLRGSTGCRLVSKRRKAYKSSALTKTLRHALGQHITMRFCLIVEIVLTYYSSRITIGLPEFRYLVPLHLLATGTLMLAAPRSR